MTLKKFDGRLLSIGGVLAWMTFAFLFVARSPSGAFNHDMPGHIQHTQILYKEKRLAFPREGWETYQPPLYYAVNTLFSPGHLSHIFRVRLMSVLYGGLTLLCIIRVLSLCGVPASAQAMVLAFISTTPAFLFMFTTYNNDSLAILLSTSVSVAAGQWILEGRRRWLGLVALLATAGLYTKLTVIFALTTIAVIGLGWVAFRKSLWRKMVPLWGALAISAFCLIPWLIGHNYRLTGQLTPVPADFPIFQESRLPSSPLRTLFTPPGWSRGEWSDSYVHVWDKTRHKKNSYLSFVFATSVFDEYSFEFLPPIIPWAILLLHGGFWIAALVRARKVPYGFLALGAIGLGLLGPVTLFFRAPYATLMDFRYIAWVWLPGSLLYATVLVSPPASSRPSLGNSAFRAAFISGTFLQGLFWLALLLGGRWNIP